MATVVELDRQIAEKDRQTTPLLESANEAHKECLGQFAAALAPMILQHARETVVNGGPATERLQSDGRLHTLRSEVQALSSEAIVKACLGAAPVWTHLRLPPPSSGLRGSFTPDKGSSPPGRLGYGWGDHLDCLSKPVESVLKKYGYQHPYMHLSSRGWPAPLWEALARYEERVQPLLTATSELESLKRERAKLAAASAWDAPE